MDGHINIDQPTAGSGSGLGSGVGPGGDSADGRGSSRKRWQRMPQEGPGTHPSYGVSGTKKYHKFCINNSKDMVS